MGLSHPGRALQVLVLDDSEVDRLRLDRLLGRIGDAVETRFADDLPSFRLRLDERKFDAIFLDYSLPAGTGLDAARMLREHPLNGSVRPIMVTGEDRSDRAVSAIRDGCANFLPKQGLSAETLRLAVSEAISQRAEAPVEAQVDAVLQAIDDAGVAQLRPIASRMMRQVRALKDAPLDERMARNLSGIDTGSAELLTFCKNFSDAIMRLKKPPSSMN